MQFTYSDKILKQAFKIIVLKFEVLFQHFQVQI